MAKGNKARFLKEFAASLNEGNGAIFIGAGVSMAAGYPSWSTLLHEIGEELGVHSGDIQDLAALAQWSIVETGNSTRILNVIKEQIGKDYEIPAALEVISRLPVKHIWTTNYDRLIERAFSAINRPIDTVSGAAALSLKPMMGATRLYKMHGSIERPDDIVISTEDYELYRRNRGAFLPLLEAQLTGMSMLFIGLSLTDPNVRHVLSLIRESFTDAPPEHFAIVRPPQKDDFKTESEFAVRSAQHKLWAKDLRRYGLIVVEIDDYHEVPDLLSQLERHVASRRVWVSGSWPIDVGGKDAALVYDISERLGRWIAASGRDLVSGSGLLVGSATISGFFDAMRAGGVWDLDRKLIVRPFPQPLEGKSPNREQWTAIRREMARQAGVIIFVGGSKMDGDKIVTAAGVFEEFELAKANGVFLLPVGFTGGAAKEIAEKLVGSDIPDSGPERQRPTDKELAALLNNDIEPSQLIEIIDNIFKALAV
ncbi:MAG: SIR2 family protein [Altererythrobacter sp.]